MALGSATVATGATGWRVVKQTSSNGRTQIPKTLVAVVDNPKPRGIAVRFKGTTSQRIASTRCLKGTFLFSEQTRTYSRNGHYVLPQPPGVTSCFVQAAIDGWGNATVQILRR